jgi:hypothetical protein
VRYSEIRSCSREVRCTPSSSDLVEHDVVDGDAYDALSMLE